MDYIVKGLPLEPFQPLFGLPGDELHRRGVVRMMADAKPGFPCRVTLQDAEPGEALLLLNWRHLDAETPYRADGPIFVREAALASFEARNRVPEQQRDRLLSVRAYDAGGWMQGAEVVEGAALESTIETFFANSAIDYLHVHNAKRGCYACRVDRG